MSAPLGRWWTSRCRIAAAATVGLTLATTAGQTAAGPAGRVRVGLEVLEDDPAIVLQNKRIGLVVTPASVTADGRHSIDVLRKAGANVVRLLAHERALRTRTAVWDKVPQNLDGTPFLGRPQVETGTRVDAETRLSILDLGTGRLDPALLRGLDAIVFDLQDPGVRFFTVVGRLQQCMEAAAEAGVEFILLDRPNPLGGERIEGPTREATPTVRPVLTNLAPGPLVHGLTAGEMAQLIRSRLDKPLRLTVVPMKGWKRGMSWTDTGRPWPSIAPNLRTPEAALAYPALGLLEATNVSEGRGTDQPFLLFGAPWIDTGHLASLSATGFAIGLARFTPRASAFAVNPKHKEAICVGGRLAVQDASAARPYELGVRLLHVLRGQPDFAWASPNALDDLVGTPRPRRALDSGKSVADILAADEPALEKFRRDRVKFLLY